MAIVIGPTCLLTSELANSAQPEADRALCDWNAYYELLRGGNLRQYANQHIVVRDGRVVACGSDPNDLRANVSALLGIEPVYLVIPFVEC